MNLEEIESKKQRIVQYSKYGIIAVFGLVVAPVAWTAITGIAGLLIASGLIAVGVTVAPVAALKLTNAKVRALEAERLAQIRALEADRIQHIKGVVKQAEEDPIETAEGIAVAAKERSKKYLEEITSFSTEISNFEERMGKFAKEYPEEGERFRNQASVMRQSLSIRKDKYEELQRNIREMDKTIVKMKAYFEMAKASQRLNSLSGADAVDPIEELRATAALNAVSSAVNRSFAEMDSALLASKSSQPAALVSNTVDQIGQSLPESLKIELNQQSKVAIK